MVRDMSICFMSKCVSSDEVLQSAEYVPFKHQTYLKMCTQRKTLLNIMSNSRIKNTVAYLENLPESRKLKESRTDMF